MKRGKSGFKVIAKNGSRPVRFQYSLIVNDSNNFSKKKIVWDKWTILGPKMVHPHNSGSAGRIF